MAARHLPRVGAVTFQGGNDRSVVAESSSVDVNHGGWAAVGAGGGVGARGDAGEGARVAEAVAGGGAFSVENELARIQGELNALLTYLTPRTTD
jgi:hypothetical protein